MVQLKRKSLALQELRSSAIKSLLLFAAAVIPIVVLARSCTARVLPNELGVEQVRFGAKSGIGDTTFGPGLYFVGLGTTMQTFPRETHLLEASNSRAEATRKAADNPQLLARIARFFDHHDRVLGSATYRRIEALNVQTSDGYAVLADVSLLYGIDDAVKIAREFGWGSLYVDAFVINTFRNGVLATLGKMSAEDFYSREARGKAISDAEALLRDRFKERGLHVERLLLRNYHYSDDYERALQEKKIAVQLTEKNRKEGLVNEQRATLQQLESKGNAAITIAGSAVGAQIAKVRAEAELYSAEVHAKADKELGLAQSEAKRLKSQALTQAGGKYVAALETAKMFDNIDAAVMTPEQYVAFIRNAWALLGLDGGRR